MASASATGQDSPMADEMFEQTSQEQQQQLIMDFNEDGAGAINVANAEANAKPELESSSSSTQNAKQLLDELTSSDRTVHKDFQKDFGIDFFDDKDLE